MCFEGFTEDDGPSERQSRQPPLSAGPAKGGGRNLRRARKTYYPIIFGFWVN